MSDKNKAAVVEAVVQVLGPALDSFVASVHDAMSDHEFAHAECVAQEDFDQVRVRAEADVELPWMVLEQLGIDRAQCEVALGADVSGCGLHPLDVLRRIRSLPGFREFIEREAKILNTDSLCPGSAIPTLTPVPPPIPDIVDDLNVYLALRTPHYEIDWTDEQLHALERIDAWRKSTGAFHALTGPAGSGKTTVLREVVARHGDATLCAMTGKAALRMAQCTGREASTLHSILYWPPKPGEDLRFTRLREPPSSLIIVDEASMTTPSVFADLQTWVNWGTKILLVGDLFQLPPVITRDESKTYGEDYSVFTEVRGAELKTVMRSAGGVLRAATKVRETGEVCRESDEGYEYARSDSPTKDAVDAYVADRDDHMLITWRNTTRMTANKMVRERLGHSGPLPDEGEPVLIKRNGQGYLNGEIVEAGLFTKGPQVGSLQTLWMTAQGNRVLVSIAGGRDGEMFDGGMPWIDDFRKYHIDLTRQALPEPLPITWGYVLTAHSAQGSQARRVTVFLERDDAKNRNFRKSTTLPSGQTVSMAARWVYTATTRSIQRTTMIVGR